MLTYEKNKGLENLPAIADTSAVRQKLVWRQDDGRSEQRVFKSLSLRVKFKSSQLCC